jgi:hypothetical protein
MKLSPHIRALIGASLCLASACSDDNDDEGQVVGLDGSIDAGADASADLDARVPGPTDAGLDAGGPLGFFVSSTTSATANLGGLTGADQRCQTLAAAVGAGGRTWRAFLSVERDPGNGGGPTSAIDRIGRGPWYNAKGELVANDVASLLTKTGDAELFVDERGTRINGQWTGSPAPNQHDILTGTALDGGVYFGRTCGDWTSEAGVPDVAQVGHSDGLGPMQDETPPRNSWY